MVLFLVGTGLPQALCERGLGLRKGDSAQAEDLAAGRFAGKQLDGGFGNGKRLGQEGDERLVGAAFERWRMHGDLELSGCAFPVEAGDGGPLCAGLRADGKRDSGGGFADHAGPV